MKVPVYYVDEDEYHFGETGKKTTISADDGAKLIDTMVSCLLGDVGRHEEPDYESVEETMRDLGMIDDDFDPYADDED